MHNFKHNVLKIRPFFRVRKGRVKKVFQGVDAKMRLRGVDATAGAQSRHQGSEVCQSAWCCIRW